jgi:GTP-binding protein Era
MNALMGEKLSIVTPKAQTTRHRIMGILNGEEYQIVYSDTPGVLDPKYKLHEGMMKFVGSALVDADLILLVIDLADKKPMHEATLNKIKKSGIPVFVVLNKYDVVGNEGANIAFEYWSQELPNAKIFPVSALHKLQVDLLLKQVIQALPDSPPYFPKDEISDKSIRFFASEIIREKIFLTYSKEIPYSTEVVIEAFRDEIDIAHINALIITERESQKAIIIGHQGKMLKKIGTEARKDIESFLDKKVMLTTHVKVDENWRNDARRLKGYGYLEE